MGNLSHFDEQGHSRMVDVTTKAVTERMARAHGRVRMATDSLRRIVDRKVEKGDVLEVARLAGIMAAKRTADLIPLCHPLPLEAVQIEFEIQQENSISIEAEVRTTARTGVEMEALTAVTVAALTIYDMCKSIDRNIRLEHVQLEEKTGGRSGRYLRPPSTEQST